MVCTGCVSFSVYLFSFLSGVKVELLKDNVHKKDINRRNVDARLGQIVWRSKWLVKEEHAAPPQVPLTAFDFSLRFCHQTRASNAPRTRKLLLPLPLPQDLSQPQFSHKLVQGLLPANLHLEIH